MKRQHVKIGNNQYLEWLKSIDCILYSPFSVDMTNYIDGKTWYKNTSYVSSLGIYDGQCELTQTAESGNTYCPVAIDTVAYPNISVNVNIRTANLTMICTQRLLIGSPSQLDSANGIYHTCFCDGAVTTGNGVFNDAHDKSMYGGLTPSSHYQYGTTPYTSFPTDFVSFGFTYSAGDANIKCYRNGVYERLSGARNWGVNSNNRSHFGMNIKVTSGSVTFAIKNCYAFSRALTGDEMMTIFQHDGL